MEPLEHVKAWWDELRRRMPAFSERNPVEWIEEQWALLEARLNPPPVAQPTPMEAPVESVPAEEASPVSSTQAEGPAAPQSPAQPPAVDPQAGT